MTGEVTRETMIEALRERVAHLEYHRGRGPLGKRLHELECMRAALREIEGGGWRPISEGPQELRERAAHMRGIAGGYRMQLCQLTHECCWAVWLGPSAGDGVTHYFTRPLHDRDERSPPITSDGGRE